MADISTGRQRGIVPFVDETTGRLPDQYLPQGVIDLQGDLKQAVSDASQSATAAKASETAAKASAESATQSASAAAQSAESASGDAAAAKTSADGAASSASAAKASETAASSSATAAASSEAAAKASETAAARSAQTATEQVSSIGDSVERAAASATAAQQSASQAQSNATAANSSAQAAAASAESAQTATESAASSKDAAARSASAASESAQAAETSKTNAAASASAAETSKTDAAAAASAAKVSETNAAASATAAQQAVDGFGLQVGTTTTGEPGSDAAVEIQKQGTKYTANFTIPRGDKGEQASVAHDGTLTGDGTSGKPLGMVAGTAVKPVDNKWNNIDFNDYCTNGIYTFNGASKNGPRADWSSGALIVLRSYQTVIQIYSARPYDSNTKMAVRYASVDTGDDPTAENWSAWTDIASKSDIPDVSALKSRIATLQAGLDEIAVMQTRVQALEARIKSLETN